MTPALLALAEGRGTSNPYLAGILLAQRINSTVGYPLVAPWEVDQLPGDWLDAFMALSDRLPAMRAGKRKVEDRLAEWRASHPTYGKRQ